MLLICAGNEVMTIKGALYLRFVFMFYLSRKATLFPDKRNVA